MERKKKNVYVGLYNVWAIYEDTPDRKEAINRFFQNVKECEELNIDLLMPDVKKKNKLELAIRRWRIMTFDKIYKLKYKWSKKRKPQ